MTREDLQLAFCTATYDWRQFSLRDILDQLALSHCSCPSNEAVEGGDRGGGLYHSPNSISRSAGYSQIALKTTSKNFEVSREESALTLDRGRVSDFPVATACDLSVESVQLRNDDHSPPVLFPMPGILHFT